MPGNAGKDAHLREVAEWLQNTPVSHAIWSAYWLIRLLESLHLLVAGVALVSGLSLALRGMGRLFMDQPFDAVWRRFAPWLGWSLAIMFVSGLTLSLAHPVRELTSTSWWIKMLLLCCCTGGTVALARNLRESTGRPSLAARALSAALVLCWLLIPLLGRMIAYDLPFWGRFSLRT